jgi:glutaredoxin 3
MAEKNTVKVYSTPTCPWCIVAKNFLKEHGIAFEEVDVSRSQKAAEEMVEKSGQMGVPVIDINNNIIIGFDENKIRSLLKIKD